MQKVIWLLLFSQLSYANICDEGYLPIKNPAEIEKDHLTSISRYQLGTDVLRKFSKQILTSTQISARQQARILNSYLEMSTDYGLFYTQFKRLFIKAELSYYTLLNLENRIVQLNQFASQLKAGNFPWEKLDNFCEKYGLIFNQARDENGVKLFLDKVISNYEKEMKEAKNIFVSSYDDYQTVRYSLDETVKSEVVDEKIKTMAQNVGKNLGVTDDELKLYPYLLREQTAGEFTKVTTLDMKNYMESHLELKHLVWKVRFKHQIRSTVEYLVVHGKYHQRLLNKANSFIPTSNVVFRGLKTILSKVTREFVDYEMHSLYAGYVGMQVHPGTLAKPIEDQIKVLKNANAHSNVADEYLIALARNVDGRETFDKIKKYVETHEDYKDLFKSMQEAETKADIIGDLALDQDKSLFARLPMYVAEMAFVWTLYEYFAGDSADAPKLELTTEEGKKLLNYLSNKKMEDLESDPTVKLILKKLGRDTAPPKNEKKENK